MVSLNRSRVEQKAEEGRCKNTFVFLAFWNSPTIFIHYSGGITLITILSGASLADSLNIAGWMGNTRLLKLEALSLAF